MRKFKGLWDIQTTPSLASVSVLLYPSGAENLGSGPSNRKLGTCPQILLKAVIGGWEKWFSG